MKAFKRSVALFVLISAGLFLKAGISLAYDTGNEEDYLIESGGPVPIRNQMPLYLFYLQMVPDKASVIERNKFLINTDYTVSNITVSAFTPSTSQFVLPLYAIDIDLEVSRFTLDFRYGLYDNLEIGLEIPYISLSSGYLDNFIEGVEDGIGARTPRSRERQGSYNFDYSFRYNDEYLINEKDHKGGLGDIVLNAKYQLVKEAWYWLWPNVSLRAAIKFPTGSESDLVGSGEFDYGIGLLVDKTFFERFFIYLGGNAVRIKKPSVLSILDIDEEIYSYMLAIEWFLTKRFSVVTQVSGNTTPYPESDTNPLDNDAHDWLVGVNYRLKKNSDISWNFAVAENISAASSPDVSFHTGLNWKF